MMRHLAAAALTAVVLLLPSCASPAAPDGASALPVLREGVVRKGDAPLRLEGAGVRVGQRAPDFAAVDTSMRTRHLSEWAGKVVVLASVPSLDTPTCSAQTRRFNEEASGLGDDVVVLTVSMDLPFAQKRWCGAAGVERVVTLSDYRDRGFAAAYGLRIHENGLLARSVTVIDRDGVIRHHRIVPNLPDEPDYAAALDAVRSAL